MVLILALFLFITCLDKIQWTSADLMKENGFILKRARSRWYCAETTTAANYADNQALLANTNAQAKSLLINLTKAARSIGLYMNSDEINHVLFKMAPSL